MVNFQEKRRAWVVFYQCRVSLCLREGNIMEGYPLKKLWDTIVFSDIYFIPDNLFEQITGIL